MLPQSSLSHGWQLGLASLFAVVGAIAVASDCAIAQIVPDDTLGDKPSVVTPSAPNSPIDLIEGGAKRGANLFHSFLEFNVDSGRTAVFINPSGIKNIFSRVTGGSRSEILGTLNVFGGSANLFLINPNGIIFGLNAKVLVGGSFVATTANAIQFGDRGFFSASAPDVPPVLTVNPSALLFNQIANQPITNQSIAGLQLLPDQSLLLVGGDVNLEGGQLSAPSGRVELGGLAGAGTVGLKVDGSNLRLSFPVVGQRADVSLSNGASVDVSDKDVRDSGGGGDIQVQGRRVTLTDRSEIAAYTQGSKPGGMLTVRASESVEVIGGSRLLAGTRGTGSAGGLTIETGKLIVQDGAQVAASTFNKGPGGTLTVRASDSVELSGTGTSADGKQVLPSRLLTQTNGAGRAGDLKIKTGRLIVRDGAQVSAGTSDGSTGQGGTLTVNASDSVELSGSDGQFTSGLFAQTEGTDNAGNLTITTRKLTAQDGAVVSAVTFDQGNGGNIRVNASNSVNLFGVGSSGSSSGLFTRTDRGGQGGNITVDTNAFRITDGAVVDARTLGSGNGGNITVNANTFEAVNGGQVLTTTRSQGRAGNISLNIPNSVTLSGSDRTYTDRLAQFGSDVDNEGAASGLFANTAPGSTGNGGTIELNTTNLSVSDRARIGINSSGRGSAGSILSVNARDTVALDNGSISSQLGTEAVGQGGAISLKAGSLSLTNGAQLQASTASQGNAGKISVNTANAVSVSGTNSGLFTNTNSSGNGGDITVDTNALSLSDNAVLNAETSNLGDGGLIQVNANTVEVSNGAVLSTSTSGVGDAGSVFVQADDSVSLANNSLIRSAVESQAVGNGNQINIQARSLSLTDGAQLRADTNGVGDAGNININATESVSVSGISSGLLTSTNSTGRGGSIRVDTGTFRIWDGAVVDASTTAQTQGAPAAGNLSITTGQLLVQDRAQVSASTSGSGHGGTLTVTAPESVTLSGMGSLSAQATKNGNAGDLTINTPALTVQDGAEVSASTISGQGGDITLGGLNSLQVSNGGRISAETETGHAGSLSVNANENAADAVQLSDPGSGLFARASDGGDAGSLTINALALNAQDGAQVTVSSPQGRAGNLTATAYTILLDQGKLTAITGAGSGGNIRLQNLDLLRMLDMSLISAEAFRAANGGNINIDTQWLVAVPKNSDIIANAIRGNGGRVDITASGIFGLQYRDRLTPESDITASSEFGAAGVVTLNTPDVDPSQGLVSLPVELVDASNSFATGCAAGGENEFIITGRGGLPPDPSDTLSSDTVWSDLRSNPKFARTPSSSEEATNPTLPEPAPIVEATGWVINNKGEVVLTATAPTATRDIPWIRPDACHTP